MLILSFKFWEILLRQRPLTVPEQLFLLLPFGNRSPDFNWVHGFRYIDNIYQPSLQLDYVFSLHLGPRAEIMCSNSSPHSSKKAFYLHFYSFFSWTKMLGSHIHPCGPGQCPQKWQNNKRKGTLVPRCTNWEKSSLKYQEYGL